LSKGKPLFGEWLQLKLSVIPQKDLELFAYLIRVLLTKIVEQAIRIRSGTLSVVTEPITVEEYNDAVDHVKGWI
jgi:hypothetical protein